MGLLALCKNPVYHHGHAGGCTALLDHWNYHQCYHRAGANDYFSIVFQNSTVMAEPVVAFIGDAMLQLYSKGARKFVLVNEPDTSTIPSFTQQAVYGFYSVSRLKWTCMLVCLSSA